MTFGTNNKDWLDYLEAFGSLVIGLATLVFAFIINRKISFKKNTIERKFEVVTDLISILQNIEFIFERENKELGMSAGTKIPFFSISTSKERLKEFQNMKMFITYNFYENLPFLKLSRHPFMPKKIAKAIDKFRISFPNFVNNEDDNRIMWIDFRNIYKGTTKDKRLIFSEYDEVCKSPESFYRISAGLDSEIRNWLKKYGVKDLNLS